MGQRKWLGTKVMKTKYHHSEDPKYGRKFQIVAVQFESIEKKFSDWIEEGKVQVGRGISIDFSEYLGRIREMGRNDLEWKKMKTKISDDVCKDFNTMMGMCTNLDDVIRVKDIVAYKIRYLWDPIGETQIL